MKYLMATYFAALCLVAVVAFVRPEPRPRRCCEGTATIGTTTRNHCGCANWQSCTVPCSVCCGPHGMDDCFKNPDPTVKTCCGR